MTRAIQKGYELTGALYQPCRWVMGSTSSLNQFPTSVTVLFTSCLHSWPPTVTQNSNIFKKHFRKKGCFFLFRNISHVRLGTGQTSFTLQIKMRGYRSFHYSTGHWRTEENQMLSAHHLTTTQTVGQLELSSRRLLPPWLESQTGVQVPVECCRAHQHAACLSFCLQHPRQAKAPG